MISIINLQISAGLPLCISGITRHVSLSKEIADHDLRRDAIKKKKTESENVADQDYQEEYQEEGDFGFDLSNKKCLHSAAKAA